MSMKRFIAVLSGLLVLPAFAEVAPIYYDDSIEMVDTDLVADDVDENVAPTTDDSVTTRPVIPTVPTPVGRNSTTGRAASRAMPASNTTGTSRNVATRGNTARTTTARTTTSSRAGVTARAPVRTNVARVAVSGAGSADASNARAAVSGTANTDSSIRRNVPTTSAATQARAATNSSIIQTDTVNTPLYTGRVGVRKNSASTRVPTIRVATAGISVSSNQVDTTEAVSTTDMDELAQITDFCKAQYAQCMDNFCNVLDDNQGRCSCSANLSKYEKTEAALKQATEELQDVAQKIQYIGLSANEIETLFTQTEAELQMQKTTDTTQLKNDLDKIKKLIVDVKTPTGTSSDNGISMDLSGLLDFSIDSAGFSLASLLGGGTNTNSVSNQRGEQLYKTATSRCKTSVLNSCTAQGVDAALITNSYDLEIDKQCIAYERSLTDANDQMSSTVRNAKSVLQKARLMVAQNKNQYDLRGCISALDSCMQDDYVCGSDYENCLDPSGKYIVNGEVVNGSTPGLPGGEEKQDKTMDGLYATWNYNMTDSGSKNAWGTGGTLADFISANKFTSASDFTTAARRNDMAGFLQQKIGYIDENGIAQGMCANVLNKCQNYSFTGTGSKSKYNIGNPVISEYLERAMIQIKTAQDAMLSDYAEGCISDVAACLNQNNYSRYSSTVYSSVYNEGYSDAAIKACTSVIRTCRSATLHAGDVDSDVYNWLDEAVGTAYWCTGKGGTMDSSGTCKNGSTTITKPNK